MVLFDEHARSESAATPNGMPRSSARTITKVPFLRGYLDASIPGMRGRPQAQLSTSEGEWVGAIRSADWRAGYIAVSVVLDVVVAICATILAMLVRFGGSGPEKYGWGPLIAPPLWIAVVAMNRAYEHRFIGVGTQEFVRVTRGGVTLMAVVAFVSYATKAEFARGYVLIAIPALVALALVGRCAQRAWLRGQRLHGRCVQRTLLVGTAPDLRWNIQRLRHDSSHGMLVVGACLSSGGPGPDVGVPILGDLGDIEIAVLRTRADAVTVLSSARLSGAELRRLAWRLESTGTELIVCSGLTEIAGARITIRPTAHSPMLQVAQARLSGPSRLAKGAFDRIAALLGLLLLSPLLLGVATCIWLGDRESPVFTQQRIGKNGRPFRIYKFRTMVPNAATLHAELLAASAGAALLFKLADDPRITPIGRVLRKYSLDELPQLVNVVRGDMSLVGPRPQVEAEVREYSHDMQRRLLVKPGLTGLWQVSGRSDLSADEAECLDVRYVENWSLALDMRVLWSTVRAVLRGAGAY